jgi:hypothetical protein
MSAREVQLLDRLVNGSKFLSSLYDTDIDIAGPKQILITTGTKKCVMVVKARGPAAATIMFKKGVVIGSGGGGTVGTAVSSICRDLAATAAPSTGFAITEDYVVGSGGGAAGGTTEETIYHFPNIESEMKFKLAASAKYGVVFTSIADNNSAVFDFEYDEEA